MLCFVGYHDGIERKRFFFEVDTEAQFREHILPHIKLPPTHAVEIDVPVKGTRSPNSHLYEFWLRWGRHHSDCIRLAYVSFREELQVIEQKLFGEYMDTYKSLSITWNRPEVISAKEVEKVRSTTKNTLERLAPVLATKQSKYDELAVQLQEAEQVVVQLKARMSEAQSIIVPMKREMESAQRNFQRFFQ